MNVGACGRAEGGLIQGVQCHLQVEDARRLRYKHVDISVASAENAS